MLDVAQIEDRFPFVGIRDNQQNAMELIIKAFNDGKKFAIMEGPTGSGKSAIGIGMANYFDKVFYITPQKILQDQIVRDFADQGAVELKGRTSYPCVYYEYFDQADTASKISATKLQKELASKPTCDVGFCKKYMNKSACKKCLPDLESIKLRKPVSAPLPFGNNYSICPYYEQVFKTRDAHIAVMNFSSFLYQTQKMSHLSGGRDLIIIDEAHNTEKELLSFASFTLNDRTTDIPIFNSIDKYIEHFVHIDLGSKLETEINTAINNCDYKTATFFRGVLDQYDLFMNNIQMDWVFEISDDGRSITFKPVYAGNFADAFIFSKGTKVLLMSATILNPKIFMECLNIPKHQATTFRLSNQFPVENRPIYIDTVAKITGGKAKQHEWEPKLIQKIDSILSKHPNERGIIHSHNFSISEAIIKKCKFRKRIFYQKDFDSKEIMLEEHAASTNGVILAPAMHEGLDLKDDLSRFQIICKVPWPNFYEDIQLKRRVDENRDYLPWLTALKLCQSVGRSIRSETDWAKTYVIDEGIVSFIQSNKAILPSWFLEALIYV